MLSRLRNWLLRLLEYPPTQASNDYVENCRVVEEFLNPSPRRLSFHD